MNIIEILIAILIVTFGKDMHGIQKAMSPLLKQFIQISLVSREIILIRTRKYKFAGVPKLVFQKRHEVEITMFVLFLFTSLLYYICLFNYFNKTLCSLINVVAQISRSSLMIS